MAKIKTTMTVSLKEFGKKAGEYAINEYEYNGLTIRQWADKITSGEYQPVRHGRWIDGNCGDYVCSVCGWEFSNELPYMAREYNAETEEIMRYCMHCGAKMDGGDQE